MPIPFRNIKLSTKQRLSHILEVKSSKLLNIKIIQEIAKKTPASKYANANHSIKFKLTKKSNLKLLRWIKSVTI